MPVKKLLSGCLTVCLLSLLTGCADFLLPRSQVVAQRTYDLGFPKKETPNRPYMLDIQQLDTDTGAKFKMVFRHGNELYQDDYNRWIQSPSSLLTKYLSMAFDGGYSKTTKAVFRLHGNLLTFEADPEQKVSRLVLSFYILRIANNDIVYNGIFKITAPLQDTGDPGKDFAESMSQAAAELVQRLHEVLSKLAPDVPAK